MRIRTQPSSGDSSLSPELRLAAMLDRFAGNDPTTQRWADNIRAAINASPDLESKILRSIAEGNIEKFDLLNTDIGTGGYSQQTKSIALTRRILHDPSMCNKLIFVLGHEVGHSLNQDRSAIVADNFHARIVSIAGQNGAEHDYTQPLLSLLEYLRQDEASAHIGGFNALASKLRHENADATLQDLYYQWPSAMKDFMEASNDPHDGAYRLKPGLRVETDLQMLLANDNIESMKIYFFDRPNAFAMLDGGRQDYRHLYANRALAKIDSLEDADRRQRDSADLPRALTCLDLNRLGLSAALVEIDDYYDTSTSKRQLAPSSDTDASPPDYKRQKLEQNSAPDARAPESTPSTLFSQAREALSSIDFGDRFADHHGRSNIAAVMALEASRAGLQEISGVVQGKDHLLVVYEGIADHPESKRIVIHTGLACQQPADESLKTLAQLTHGHGEDSALRPHRQLLV
jgi:Peptidase family M48